jgi:prephenate dehydrogenase
MSEETVQHLKSALIIGGCGGFGRRFATEFQQSGLDVTTLDVVAGADYVFDVSQEPRKLAEICEGKDLVLLCLNEAATLRVLPAVSEVVDAETVLADICSVKTNVCEWVSVASLACEYLSLHPMFGPERPLLGNNLVVIPVNRGAKALALTALLQSWQLNVLETSALEHDAVTAMVQIVPHAVLASFAKLRSDMSVSDELIDAFATPIFRDLERVAMSLVNENPDLYHNIQTANPNGPAARAALSQAVSQALAALSDDDPASLRILFNAAKSKSP